MKKILFPLVFVLFVSSFCFSQSDIAEIKKQTKLYFEALKEENYDKRLDYFHPKVFEVLSKKEMKDEMIEVFNSEEIKFEFLSIDILSISDIVTYDGNKYALVHDSTKSKMIFLDLIDKSKEETNMFLKLVKENLESKFENRSAIINADTASLIVTKNEYSYIIYEKNTGWKFLSYSLSLKSVFQEIVPADVRTKLKI